MHLRSEVKKYLVIKENLFDENREHQRKIDVLRIICRKFLNCSFNKRSDIDNISNFYFKIYQRLDGAALVIQRFWRQKKNQI
jgi:hypothetical protein